MPKNKRKLEDIYGDYKVKKDKENEKRRQIYAKKRKEDVALQRVLSAFQSAYDYRLPLEQYWNQWYKQYRQYLSTKTYPGKANVFVPYSFMIVESIAPKLIANNPRIEIYPENKPFDTLEEQKELEEKAKRVRSVVYYQWEESKMRFKIYEWVKNSLIYGTSWAKVCWNVKEETPYLEPLDIFDVYCDPSATCVEEAQFIIHKTNCSFNELKKNPNYINLDKLKVSIDNSQFADNPNTDSHKYERQMDVLGLPPPPMGNKQIRIKEFWGTFEYEGVTDEYIITVANDEIVIRCELNPYIEREGKEVDRYKPFLLLRDQVVPGELYGIGECESVQYQQRELNTNRNQRIDNKNLIINKQYKVRRNANVNPTQLRSVPGNVVFVDNMDDVQELQTSSIGMDVAYKEESIIKDDMQNITGATPFALGHTTTNVTATTEVSRQEEANDRFRMKLSLLEIELKRLGEMMLAMDREWITKDVIVRITGDQTKYTRISPADFEEEYALQIGVGSTQPMNKATKLAQFMNIYQYLRGNVNIDQRLLDRHLIELWDEDLATALLPNEEIAQTGGQMMMGNNPAEGMMLGANDLNNQAIDNTNIAEMIGGQAGQMAQGEQYAG